MTQFNQTKPACHTLSVAPMLDWTHKHCRYFHRLLSKHAVLYTEMVTTGAIIYGDKHAHLEFNSEEQPVVLQLGGSDIEDLAKCAQIAQEYGYSAINLNCGCPSPRVQKGAFGACLMLQPKLVKACVEAMQNACDLPITLKHRIGIDDMQDYAFVYDFVAENIQAGCQTFIVHARSAWLKGLSPKENRSIPPLNYDYVYRLKQDFKDAQIILNGGLENVTQVLDVLKPQINQNLHAIEIDGVMLGRAAYNQPFILHELETALFNQDNESANILNYTPSSAIKHLEIANLILEQMQSYAQLQLIKGVYLGNITQPMLGLMHGLPLARIWRQHLSNHTLLRQVQNEQTLQAFFTQAHTILEEMQKILLKKVSFI